MTEYKATFNEVINIKKALKIYLAILESQAGKMKCCGNCFNFSTDKRCADKIGSEVCDRWCITL